QVFSGANHSIHTEIFPSPYHYWPPYSPGPVSLRNGKDGPLVHTRNRGGDPVPTIPLGMRKGPNISSAAVAYASSTEPVDCCFRHSSAKQSSAAPPHTDS